MIKIQSHLSYETTDITVSWIYHFSFYLASIVPSIFLPTALIHLDSFMLHGTSIRKAIESRNHHFPTKESGNRNTGNHQAEFLGN